MKYHSLSHLGAWPQCIAMPQVGLERTTTGRHGSVVVRVTRRPMKNTVFPPPPRPP
ncbi:MAG: hypothetical protein OT477_02505 [Chloroflexi bacterium]|nr:hypothetical protein [Chloroflexota bacterium]